MNPHKRYWLRAKVFLLWVMVLSTNGFSQSIQHFKTISLNNRPVYVSVDRIGNIVYGDHKGNIYMLDVEGTEISRFSSIQSGHPSMLEAWSAMRIFVFHRENQSYYFLDRFLVQGPVARLHENTEVYARIATVSSDNGLWLFDDREYSLKKMDLELNRTVISTSLNNLPFQGAINVGHMREYHNRLFLSDPEKGILLFDLFGNYIKSLPALKADYFNFLNNELYYLQDDELRFYDLYDHSERSITLPAQQGYSYVLISKNRLMLFSDKELAIFKLYKN